MANVTYDQANEISAQNGRDFPSYFSLANDGDETLVRFLHDSTDSFDIVTTHGIKLADKFRTINCIRDPHDPLENCPLCGSGNKPSTGIYIHMIQYEKDSSGNIIPSLKVWSRGINYARKLKSLIDEYGPLSDCIFKIRRNGKSGSRETTYDIMFGNPKIYSNDMYPIPEGAFEDYKAVGTCVMDKSYQDICVFMSTGKFPEAESKEETPVEEVRRYTPEISTDAPKYSQQDRQAATANPTYSAPPEQVRSAPPVASEQPATKARTLPWETPATSSPVVDRPVRRY